MTKNEDLKACGIPEVIWINTYSTPPTLTYENKYGCDGYIKYTRPTITMEDASTREDEGLRSHSDRQVTSSTTDGDAERQKIIVSKMRNLLSMYLSMWETARSQARDFGSREMVKEFNNSCAEGARIQGQIEQYFAVKTIDEARELLEIFGGKVDMSL